ncbi:hypothetical protein S7711_06840 [Stachybotrys chartarum IBT 7711]|uniref:FAD-binding domain-containing protein n=1 Tax=Stachybotrys chartarum (strain CBS 109288 / IBT 7711) TaxID=1280523 RepID=A0A084B792_STACB|nr:hypothetical protein S7711_06840 [Stachybotrys chartarum IBT 7711]KFA48096.1 hypothetical protein S40293_08364 [Stachybotrys chartarum IBT 40293]
MKVLISGGGIAGPALAFWFAKLGYNVTVVERFPRLRTNGLQIDLRESGVEVLKRMGLEEAFRAKAVEEAGTQLVDSSGKRRAWFPATKQPGSFTSEYEIMRGDLCQLFYDATKESVEYVFGTWITSFEENEQHVKVNFANGTTDNFDLLVGADGQNSRTRKMMLGSDVPDAFHPFRDVTAYYSIRRPVQEGEEFVATMYVTTGNRAMMTRRTSPDKLLVYAGGAEPEELKDIRPGDVEAQKKALCKMYKGAGWITEELLEAAKDSTDFHCERLGMVKLDSWSKGRVVLVGDAAYCPSANTGMGTTLSVLGAYILAGEIGKRCGRGDRLAANGATNTKTNLLAAFDAYERTLRPFTDFVQGGVPKEGGSAWFPTSAFGIWAAYLIMGVASALRINLLGAMFIQRTPKGWETPDYSQVFSL